jgi:hypothetical protein
MDEPDPSRPTDQAAQSDIDAPTDQPAPTDQAAGSPPGPDAPVDDGGGDTSFLAELPDDIRTFGAARPLPVVCQWCNVPLTDSTVPVCPSCGGRLHPIDEKLELPGVTAISPEAKAAAQRAAVQAQRSGGRRARSDASAGPATVVPPLVAPPTLDGELPPAPPPVLDDAAIAAAIQPPDADVQRLMREMELASLRASLERESLPLEAPGDPDVAQEAAAPEPAGENPPPA